MHGIDEIDRALEEFNAMELFQAKEMVRHAAHGEATLYEALEWRGLQYVYEKGVSQWGTGVVMRVT